MAERRGRGRVVTWAWRRVGGPHCGSAYADWMRLRGAAGARPYWTLPIGSPEPTGSPELKIVTREAAADGGLLTLEGVAPGAVGDEIAIAPAPDRPPPRPAPEPAGGRAYDRDAVVVAVIDDGVPFLHERLLARPGETRVDRVWLQGAATDDGRAPFGRVVTGAEIDAALATGGEELDLYRRLGAAGPGSCERNLLARRFAHGAAVLDLAAGLPVGSPLGPKRPVLAVDLPARAVGDTSGAFMDFHVIAALRWIVSKAEQMGGGCNALPLVVNLSFALTAGPRDGSSPIERAIDALVRGREARGKPPMRVVLPTGNARLGRLRARLTAPAGGSAAIGWRVPPDDATPSFVEIWLPPAGKRPGTSALRVRLTPPRGAVADGAGPAAPGDAFDLAPAAEPGRPVARVYHGWRPGGGGRECVVIALAPTADGGDGPRAPAGLWGIELSAAAGGPDLALDLAIQRDDTPEGYGRGGRQSSFEAPGYRAFDEAGRPLTRDGSDEGPVRRAGTINALATAGTALVIAGYRARDGAGAPYSGLGDDRTRPTAAAPSETGAAHQGLLVAGPLSGYRAPASGTSFAAPQVSRWCADRLAAWSVACSATSAIGGMGPLRAAAALDDPRAARRPGEDEIGAGRLRLSPSGEPPGRRRIDP